MNFEYDECERQIKSIMRKLPVLKTAQLEKTLRKLCKGVETKEAVDVALMMLQRRNQVFFTGDGYALSKEAYITATEDRYLTNVIRPGKDSTKWVSINSIEKKLESSNLLTDAIDCYWLVCELLPEASNFITNISPPWALCFQITDEQGEPKIIEMMKFKAEYMRFSCELLNLSPCIPEEMQKDIIRIALIDDENYSSMIPRKGFRKILKLDDKSSKGYITVEERTLKDAWGLVI